MEKSVYSEFFLGLSLFDICSRLDMELHGCSRKVTQHIYHVFALVLTQGLNASNHHWDATVRAGAPSLSNKLRTFASEIPHI